MLEENCSVLNDRDILVVEDDPEINHLVGAYVELAGFHYVAALDGRAAMNRARDCHLCAVVLDLMLPDMSGWEICRQLKADLQTHDIPVIILSALDNDDSRREGSRCGAAEYLTKPFDPDRLLDVLARHAGRREPAAASSE